MNWLKRLLHLEEPEPKLPVLEPCPICGRTPKPKYVYDAILTRYCCQEDKDVPKWNIGCRLLRTIVAAPVPECPVCGEKPTVQPDTESDIPQLVCSCNELLGNDGITNVYQRKHEWIRRCVALKRKQDNVSEMEQLIGETQ